MHSSDTQSPGTARETLQEACESVNHLETMANSLAVSWARLFFACEAAVS